MSAPRLRLLAALCVAPLVAIAPTMRMAGCAASVEHAGHHGHQPASTMADTGCCLVAPCGATWRPGEAPVLAPARTSPRPVAMRGLVPIRVAVLLVRRQPPATAPPLVA
jgi:hypothetical protein